MNADGSGARQVLPVDAGVHPGRPHCVRQGAPHGSGDAENPCPQRTLAVALDGSGAAERIGPRLLSDVTWADGGQSLIHMDEPGVLYKTWVDGRAPPRQISPPLLGGSFDWYGDVPARPAGADRAAPTVATFAAAGRKGRLPYLVADRSGVTAVRAAVGRRFGHGRCRFSDNRGRRGRARSRCTGRSPVGRQRTARLPRWRYVVRFRARDVLDNVTRRPRAVNVRLR